MAKSLGEVLNIAPGTLIKGLKVTSCGKVVFCINGWEFEQRRLVKSIITPNDRERFCYTYYKNSKVNECISNKSIHITNRTNISYNTLRSNGESFFKDVQTWFARGLIDNGECLGMSLGENFIAIQPAHYDMYRSDFYELYVFHKILNEGSIKWIVLQAKQVSKQLILCHNPGLMDIILEML